jgi:hypothetical protein
MSAKYKREKEHVLLVCEKGWDEVIKLACETNLLNLLSQCPNSQL